MSKIYQPKASKPEFSKLYGPVEIVGWPFGGDKNIDTGFSYTAKLNASLDRSLVDGSMLDYLVVPSIAYYGQFAINPAGVAARVAGSGASKKLQYTRNLSESVIQAHNAMNYLVNQQRTDLQIVQTKAANDPNFPVILTYLLGIVYNTQPLVLPYMLTESMFSYINSLKDMHVNAAARVDTLMRVFERRAFKSKYEQYKQILKATPLHTTSIEQLHEFLVIEKLNKDYNTSYDYLTWDWGLGNDEKEVYKVQLAQSKTPQSILVDTSVMAHPDLVGRGHLTEIMDIIFANDDQFNTKLEDFTSRVVMGLFVNAYVAAIQAITAMATIYAPFYAAVPFLRDYLDMSMFNTIGDIKFEIRRSAFYAKSTSLRGINVTDTWPGQPSNAAMNMYGKYPTLYATVPLYNGRLEPDNTYDSNGFLYVVDYNNHDDFSTVTYMPFVELGRIKLTSASLYTSLTDAQLSSYFSNQTYKGVRATGILNRYEFQYEEADAVPVIDIIQNNTLNYVDMIKNPANTMINWITAKTDMVKVFVHTRNGSTITDRSVPTILKNPALTGARVISVLPVDQIVTRGTAKLLGIRSVSAIR